METHFLIASFFRRDGLWIPAFAGMTKYYATIGTAKVCAILYKLIFPAPQPFLDEISEEAMLPENHARDYCYEMKRQKLPVCYIHVQDVTFDNIDSPNTKSKNNQRSTNNLYPVSITSVCHLFFP